MNSRERKRKILNNYMFIPLQIQNLQDQYTELFTTATHITTSYEDKEGSFQHSNESKVEKQSIKLAEISLRIEKAKQKKQKIDNAVAALKPYYRFLITEIDIKNQGVSRVAKKVKKDVSSLHKTHNAALDALNL